MTVTILLADDHQLMREGVRSLLDKHSEMRVIGEASDGRTAIRLARKLKPAIVVMDVAMADLNGIEATRRIKTECPEAKVVALSIHEDRRFVRGMFEAGASGYVHKSSAFEDLVEAILTVARNAIYTSPKITGVVMKDYVGGLGGPQPGVEPQLTARQREVVQLLAEGHATKGIANRLHISVNTVETHRRRVMAKLGLHSVAELTKYAIREGLTSL